MIQVDTTYFVTPHTGSTLGVDVTYENTQLGGIQYPTFPEWVTCQEVGGAQYGSDYVMSYLFTFAENEGGVRYGQITYACTDTTGGTYNNYTNLVQGSGEIIEAPIWKDTYYLARGANLFRYSINYNGVGIYYGKSYSSPGAAGAYVQLNKICGNFLKNNVGDLSQYDDDVVENVGAVGLFSLCNEDGIEVCNYRFLLDYAGDWSGESPYVMTTTINGHIDPRMKALCTIYCDEETDIWWEIGENENTDWRSRPVTFQILTGGTLTITETVDQALPGKHTMFYKHNGVDSGYFTPDRTINVSAGDIVELYGFRVSNRGPTINALPSEVVPENDIRIGGTAWFNLCGNMMSLEVPNDEQFKDMTELPYLPPNTQETFSGYETYYALFAGSNVVSARNLILPALDLTKYNTITPYSRMFYNSKLKYPPKELPAMNLCSGCYSYMFTDCTNLEISPDLPAPTINNRCYEMMFYGCSNLKYVKCLATQYINSSAATYCWLTLTNDNGTFAKEHNANWATDYDYGIKPTWTIINA